LGVLAARPLLIHCVTVSDDDLGTIARHSCAIAHCPASNAKLGHGIAPLGRMLKHGVRVGLGSDSVASNNRMDMLDEARLAVLLQRASERRHDVLPAAEAIQLATRGGAEALGLGSVAGTLEAGKAADLAAFSLGSPRDMPVYRVEDALLWAGAGRVAQLVVVEGRDLVRDGRLLRAVPDAIRLAGEAAAALSAWRDAPDR
ncbi:MAG: amidohydrolase family protein, partial [Gemmatimonadaceae bacterium]